MKSVFKLKILLFIALIGWALIIPSEIARAAAANTGACGFGGRFDIHFNNGTTQNAVGNLPAFCTAASVASFAINLLLGLSGAVAVVFLMLGGFWYLTSAGNEEQAEKGRKVLTNAVIGLVVIIMSFALVRIAINLLTSSTGGTATTPAASGGATPPGGVTTPTNPSPAGGSQANSVTPDSGNILSNLSQQDLARYDGQEHLSGTVTFTAQTTGFSAVSTVQASDIQSLGQIDAACGAATRPDLELFVGGKFYSSGQYTNSGSGSWNASLNYPLAPAPGQQFQIYICGHATAATYNPVR